MSKMSKFKFDIRTTSSGPTFFVGHTPDSAEERAYVPIASNFACGKYGTRRNLVDVTTAARQPRELLEPSLQESVPLVRHDRLRRVGASRSLLQDAEDRNHFTESDHTDLYTARRDRDHSWKTRGQVKQAKVETRREALLSQLRTLEQPHSTAESLLSAFNTEEAPSDLSETDLYRRQAYELTQASVAGEQALLQQQRTVCQDLRDDINQLPLEVQHVCQLLEGFLEEEVMREGQREPRGALRGRRHNKKGVSLRDVFASPDSRDAQELYRLGLKSSGEIKRALYLVGKSEDEHRKWELQQLHQMEDEKHSHDVALERKRQEALGADVIAHLREARLNSSSKVTGSLKGFFNAALQSQEELMGRAKAMEDAPVSTHEGLVDAHITGEHQDLPKDMDVNQWMQTKLLNSGSSEVDLTKIPEEELPVDVWLKLRLEGKTAGAQRPGNLAPDLEAKLEKKASERVAMQELYNKWEDNFKATAEHQDLTTELLKLEHTDQTIGQVHEYAQKFGEVRTGSLQREIGLSNVLLAHQSASSSREVQHEVEDAISKWRHGADGRRPAQKGCHEVKSALECCLFYDASGGEYDTEKCLAKDGGGSFTTGTPCVAALWLHGHLREAVNAVSCPGAPPCRGILARKQTRISKARVAAAAPEAIAEWRISCCAESMSQYSL
ncbi:hypothetical protein CYMTET_56317 [Cymbomonas tetramitiformis]|uniref:Uncharacterized protein n=1 Tax=Cymbomonas tetramitiformis TaxID=36881 RepID=A0AAE0BBI4_9CHLO|nr:hypothetical protein CYMTET_56317 [Cymbomonas tetramitiformis]